MNSNILEHPLFWFIVFIISNLVVVSNRMHRKKLIAEATKDNHFGELLLPFDFTALIGWILILVGAFMSSKTITPSTPFFEIGAILLLSLVGIFALIFRDIIEKKLRLDILLFWSVRTTQFMSLMALFGFYQVFYGSPELWTPSRLIAIWMQNSLIASANVFFGVVLIYGLFIIRLAPTPEQDAYKRHLKSLWFFNPITSVVTIPLWAIYHISRALFSLIATNKK
jgi:hypothetical protein